MHVVRFIDVEGAARWGRAVDEQRALPMIGDPFGTPVYEDEPVEIGRRLAPANPPNILAIGRNYRAHAREMSAGDVPDEPLVFLKATTSIVGPDEPIVLPPSAPHEVDFEAELAVIVGAEARNIAVDHALEYVLGYTCANDITARDCQKRRDKQWTRAKSFDTFCPLGPVLVTVDAFRPDSARVRSILNGQVMQDGNTADMVFSVPALISFLSHQFTLLPGTVILTGTPPGVGYGRSPRVFLGDGDEISVEIDGIGCLRNHVLGPRT